MDKEGCKAKFTTFSDCKIGLWAFGVKLFVNSFAELSDLVKKWLPYCVSDQEKVIAIDMINKLLSVLGHVLRNLIFVHIGGTILSYEITLDTKPDRKLVFIDFPGEYMWISPIWDT